MAADEAHSTDSDPSLLHLLVESVQDYAIYALDVGGRIASWNRGAERIKGYSRGEIVGQHFSRFFAEEDRVSGKPATLLRTAELQGRVEDEAWRVRKDGSRFWANVVITALRSERGDLVGFAKVTRDLTERRRAELELRTRERQLRDTQSLAGLGSWEWPVGTDKLRWTDELYAIYGVDPGSFTPTLDGYIERVHPEDRARVRREVEDAYRTGEPFDLAERIVRPDGEVRVLRSRGYMIVDESGAPSRLVGASFDVTELKRLEEKAVQLAAQKAARETAEIAANRLRFLVEASEMLASSLDYDLTLHKVAEFAVPRVADWCAVDLVQPDGTLKRVAVSHSDPAKVELATRYHEQYPPLRNAPSGAWHVISTAEVEYYPDISDDLLEGSVKDERQLQILRELGLKSAITVPLSGQSGVLGSLSLIQAESGRRLTEGDAWLARELGRFAAVAIENARLHSDLAHQNGQLQEQSAELEMQSDELRAQAAQLEEVSADLDAANLELRSANSALKEQAIRAEHARLEAHEARTLLDGFFTAAPVAAGFLDRDLRYQRVNAALAAMNGMAADEILGRTLEEVIPELAAQVKPFYREVLETGEPVLEKEIVGRRVSSNSGEGHYVTSYFPVKDAEQAVLGVGVVVQDVTEQRQAERTEAEQARVIETLHRVGRTVAAELDAEKIVQEVTDAATSLTGAQFGAFFYNVLNEKGEAYTLYTISGVPRENFSKFPMPRATRVFEPTFHGTSVVRSDDITTDARYGHNAPYHGMPKGHLPVRSYLAVPVISRFGDVLGGLFFGHAEPGVFREAHEQLGVGIASWAAVALDNARLYEGEHRARAEAERANQVKSEFLATMSHELRTPLNATIGYAQLMLDGIPAAIPEPSQEQARRILLSAQHLLALIEEILTFSRLEAGEERIDVASVDLGEALHEVCVLTEPLAQQKGLRFELRAPDDAGTIETDGRKLRQILLNLAGNSVKFTDSGEIRISLEIVGTEVYFQISDTGPGIAPEHLEKVFDPFWQVDLGPTRAAGGTGLGLSVSRRLARLMGGEIELTSEFGVGSTFTLRLPRVFADSEDEA